MFHLVRSCPSGLEHIPLQLGLLVLALSSSDIGPGKASGYFFSVGKVRNTHMAPKSLARGKSGSNGSATIVIILATVLLAVCILGVINSNAVTKVYSNVREKFTQIPVEVVLLYSDQCYHCKTFHPTFDAAVERIKVKAKKVERQSPEFTKYNCSAFPTVVVMAGAQEKARKVGAVPFNDLTEFLMQNSS